MTILHIEIGTYMEAGMDYLSIHFGPLFDAIALIVASPVTSLQHALLLPPRPGSANALAPGSYASGPAPATRPAEGP